MKLNKIILESVNNKINMSEGLVFHIKNEIPITENIYRPNSKFFLELFNEVRKLNKLGVVYLNESEEEVINTEIGKRVKLSNGKVVNLDLPYVIQDLNEADYNGKNVQLNRPMRNSGGNKKYVVYVKNPSSGKVKKISFGDVHGGLTAKVSNAQARKSFAARHQCHNKKDKTKAGYWACRINRYGHLWGGKTYPGYW